MIETDSSNFRSSICSQFEDFRVRFCLWCGGLQCSVWSVFLLYKHLQVLISGSRRYLMLVSQWFPQWKDIKKGYIPNASTGMDDRICSDWEEGSGLLIQEKSCSGKKEICLLNQLINGNNLFTEFLDRGVMTYFTKDQIPFITSIFINILLINIIITGVIYLRYTLKL